MSIRRHPSLVAVCVCLLTACSSDPERERAIGEAYVGPAKLTLKKELSQRSEVVAELKHGERLEVLGSRRRFYRVRNIGGSEGWLDGRSLLTGRQMRDLEKMQVEAAKLPSQGTAISYDLLNVHTEASRQSPSPFQIPAGGSVEVLAHTVSPRLSGQPPALNFITVKPAPKKSSRRKKKSQKQEEKIDEALVPPPPMPPAPKPPADWREMSRTMVPGAEAPKRDDWTLVRLPNKNAGWVLTRALSMGLPDDVAQYANGKRITSYFQLAEIIDEDKKKGHWLMTTVSEPYRSYDFDHFRVFIWNLKRHRYETAYAGRDFRGFYPVQPHQVEFTEGKQKLKAPGFTIFLEDLEGRRWKNTYALYGLRVRLLSKEAAAKPQQPLDQPRMIPTALPLSETAAEKPGLFTRIRNLFR